VASAGWGAGGKRWRGKGCPGQEQRQRQGRISGRHCIRKIHTAAAAAAAVVVVGAVVAGVTAAVVVVAAEGAVDVSAALVAFSAPPAAAIGAAAEACSVASHIAVVAAAMRVDAVFLSPAAVSGIGGLGLPSQDMQYTEYIQIENVSFNKGSKAECYSSNKENNKQSVSHLDVETEWRGH
jgi:hypothetical protein